MSTLALLAETSDVAQQGEAGRALPDELPGRGGLELFRADPGLSRPSA